MDRFPQSPKNINKIDIVKDTKTNAIGIMFKYTGLIK